MAATLNETTQASPQGAVMRSMVELVLHHLAPLLGLLVLWQLVCLAIGSPFFPTPLAIVSRLREDWFSLRPGDLFLTDMAREHVGSSMARLSLGWAAGAVGGIALGLAIGLSRALNDYVGPVLHFVRSLPKTALVPIFLIVFGGGDLMRVAVIGFAVVWPVLLNTIEGVSQVGRGYLDTARAFNIGSWRTWVFVVIPAASPHIAAGLRIGISLALVLLTVSEMILSTSGLGYVLLSSQRRFDFVGMWAVMAIFGMLGYVLNAAFAAGERRVLRWHAETAGGR